MTSLLNNHDLDEFLSWYLDLEKKAVNGVGIKSLWFYSEKFDCYIRSNSTLINGFAQRTICFSNIEVKSQYTGNGILTGYVRHLAENREKLLAEYLVFQDVGNYRLSSWLVKNGFFELTNHNMFPSYCKSLDSLENVGRY